MTGEQKQEIYIRRKQKQTFAAIAHALGLPTGTVKTFCWRNGLSDVEIEQNAANQGYRGFCKNCGTELVQKPKSRPKIFCCDKCRYAWWRGHSGAAKKTLVVSKCAHCGAEIYGYSSQQKKYCSHECYIAHRYHKGESDHDD